jgi:hypothetical protein
MWEKIEYLHWIPGAKELVTIDGLYSVWQNLKHQWWFNLLLSILFCAALLWYDLWRHEGRNLLTLAILIGVFLVIAVIQKYIWIMTDKECLFLCVALFGFTADIVSRGYLNWEDCIFRGLMWGMFTLLRGEARNFKAALVFPGGLILLCLVAEVGAELYFYQGRNLSVLLYVFACCATLFSLAVKRNYVVLAKSITIFLYCMIALTIGQILQRGAPSFGSVIFGSILLCGLFAFVFKLNSRFSRSSYKIKWKHIS